MLTALLTLALAQALPPAEPRQPSTEDAPSAARLLFQAGDLRRAISMAKACAGSKKKGFKECALMVKPLVEFQAIMDKTTPLTADDARALLEYQQVISPLVPSNLTAEVTNRYVTRPWEQAVAASRVGDMKQATELAHGVLKVLPTHEGALALLAPADAGPSDAGHPKKPSREAGTHRDAGR